MRIVMLGKTGVGKSSLANTILGEDDVFPIGDTANSETSECRSKTRPVDGRDVTLIDTPGLFDTGRSEEELKPEIVKCITECSPGPHAFLIVFKVERFTVQEQEVINKINQYFSEEAFKYATVLFTHGDQLKEGQTIEQFFHNNEPVSDLVKKCGGRCHVVDNNYWKKNKPYEYRCNKFHVKQLMKTIDHMIKTNKGSCFTNEMLQAVEEHIQEEEKQIRQSPGNKTEKEIRGEATNRVFEGLLIKLAGFTTGALLGALPRVVSAVGAAAAEQIAQLTGLKIDAIAGDMIKAGITGYNAAKGGDKPIKAAKRAVDAVLNVSPFFKDQKKQQRTNLNQNV